MGKRKHKSSKKSHLRKKLKRLEKHLLDCLSNSDESSEEECDVYDQYYAPSPRESSNKPTSDIEILPLSDSDDDSINPQLRSAVYNVRPDEATRSLEAAAPAPTTNGGHIVTEAVCHPDPTATSKNEPGPSTSSETPSLPADILEALGDPKGKEEVFGPKIPDEIAKRWGRVLVNGLTKEEKQEITEKSLVPDNFRLVKAPLLNPEIVPVLSEPARNRDKLLEKSQNQLGLGISGLTNLASYIIEGTNDKIEILKKISAVSQIFLDLHHEDTKRRRKLITSCLDKKFLHMITDVKRDTYLFGTNLSEKIKTSKTAERSGLQIKRIDPAVSSSRKQTQQGNWRVPTRAQVQRSQKPGGKNRYASQSNRRPQPATDRPPRAPPKSSANTRKHQ